jgi:hypothetical protein
LDQIVVLQKKRPNTVQPLGEISDPAKSQGPNGATPIRGARLSYVLAGFFFFGPFFFLAMTIFLPL